MSFDWGKYKGGSGHPFVKFENVGDSFTGHVVNVREHLFPGNTDETALIDLVRSDGENFTLSCDKLDLKQKLADLEPWKGDKLRVTFTGTERTPNGNTMKVFEVQHKKNDRPELVTAPAPTTTEEAPPEQWDEEPF